METHLDLSDIEGFEFEKPCHVYDLTVENNHNYYLESEILVHNTSKTWDTCIFICQYIQKKRNKKIVICRDTLTSLNDTTWETFQNVWRLFNYPMHVFGKRVTNIKINSNTISFIGVNDNIAKTHGLESDLLYINEALFTSQETRDNLEQRCKEFFIYDYNPNEEINPLYDYENRADYKIFKTTIFDNKYAPDNAVAKIIGYACIDPEKPNDDGGFEQAKKIGYSKREWGEQLKRNKILGTANLYMWKVYGLGMRAAGEDLIFTDLYRYEEDPTDFEYSLYGIDFGYKADETGIVRIYKKGHEIYLKELCYKTGMLNQDICFFMHENEYTDLPIICDSAPAQNVDELRAGVERDGVRYSLAADATEKFQGSKMWGFDYMMQFKIHIHKDSTNMWNEFRKKKYARMKNGQFKRNTLGQRVPEDGEDHLIQASSYACTYWVTPPTYGELKEEEK